MRLHLLQAGTGIIQGHTLVEAWCTELNRTSAEDQC
jgi:hypothetical protein